MAKELIADDEGLDAVSRLMLVNVLCRMQREYSFKPVDADQLFAIILAVAVDPDDAEKLAKIDRNGRLTRALEQTFPREHVLWGFIQWNRPTAD